MANFKRGKPVISKTQVYRTRPYFEEEYDEDLHLLRLEFDPQYEAEYERDMMLYGEVPNR